MASNSREKDHDSIYFISKTPHFFKILQRDAIEHGKLTIPAQFVRKHGNGISSPVYLKVPSGDMWQVEFEKSNGEIWLQNGWREFVEHYSLELQDFVVFRYEGNCLFNVIIFGKSASEIEYRTNNNQGQTENLSFNGQSQGPSTEEDDDISVEILDDMPVSPSKKRREKSPLPCPRPRKKMRGSIAAKKGYGEINALQKASSFKSPNPHFRVVMRSSYVYGKYRLGIPCRFARQHLMQKHAKVLCVMDGKTWSMEYNNSSAWFRPRLCHGWKQFVHDNKLDLGDVCVFELVKSTEIRFNVVVFRSEDSGRSLADENGDMEVRFNKVLVTEHASKRKGKSNQVRHKKTKGSLNTKKDSSLRTLSIFEASSNFVLEDPNFKVLIRSCFLNHGCLTVPIAFTRKYFMTDTGDRMVTLQVAERSWPVKLKSYGSKSLFTGGWNVFARENALRADDLCMFELIDRSDDAVLRVSILKQKG